MPTSRARPILIGQLSLFLLFVAAGALVGFATATNLVELLVRAIYYGSMFGYIVVAMTDLVEHFRLEKALTGTYFSTKAVPFGESLLHLAAISLIVSFTWMVRPLSKVFNGVDWYLLAVPGLFFVIGWLDELVYHQGRTKQRENILHTVSHIASGTMLVSCIILRMVLPGLWQNEPVVQSPDAIATDVMPVSQYAEPTLICPSYIVLAKNAPQMGMCAFAIKNNLYAELSVQMRKTQDWKYATIQSITVKQGYGAGASEQTLKASEVETPYSELDRNYLTAQDVNFDGYQDIVLSLWAGATGNQGSKVWLYDPTSSTYIYNDEVSKLTSIALDPTNKIVNSHSNAGAGCWWNGDYQWQEGKLVLIRYERTDCNDTQHDTRITGELKEGRMIVTSTTREFAR